jgi:hypothetical protein
MIFSAALEPLQAIYQRIVINNLSPIKPSSSLQGGRDLVPSPPHEEERAVRCALANLLTAFGELRKYEISIHSYHQLLHHGEELPSDWSHAITWYLEAVKVCPFDGVTYRPLATISRSQGQLFETAYYLSRSMMAEDSLVSARELLLDIFETSRTQAEQFPVVTALTRMSQHDHVLHFQPHFLAAVGIAFSRTSADTFGHHMERCRRHLSTILQLLMIDILHDTDSGKGSKGDFTQFDQFGLLSSNLSIPLSLSSSSTEVIDELFSKASRLSEMIQQAVVVIIGLLELLAQKHQLKELFSTVHWDQAYTAPSAAPHLTKNQNSMSRSTVNPSELSLEEKLVMEKRYSIQCLHKVQCIPGFLDLARLLLGIIATLISSEGVGVGTRTGVSSQNNLVSTILLTATCPAVALFFDWISDHPEFHLLSVLDKLAWEQMESDLAVYLSSLSQWTQTKTISLELKQQPWHQELEKRCWAIDPAECLLKEDFALEGFLPLRSRFQKRSQSFCQSLASSPHSVSNALQLESLQQQQRGGGTTKTTGELDSLFESCDLVSIVSSLRDSAKLVVYAHRAVDTVKRLCSQPIVFGITTTTGICFDKSRNILYPSAVETHRDQVTVDPKTCLCVVVYRAPMTMRATGFMTSGHTNSKQQSIILTEEEFLQGLSHKPLLLPLEDLDTPAPPLGHAEPSPSLTETLPAPPDSPPEDTGETFPQESGAVAATLEKGKGLLKLHPSSGGEEKGVFRINVPHNPNPKKSFPSQRLPHSAAPLSKQIKETELPLIVVDTPNVAMRHGLNTKFSCRGIKLAIDFFHSAGHRVVAFLPVWTSSTLRSSSTPLSHPLRTFISISSESENCDEQRVLESLRSVSSHFSLSLTVLLVAGTSFTDP